MKFGNIRKRDIPSEYLGLFISINEKIKYVCIWIYGMNNII